MLKLPRFAPLSFALVSTLASGQEVTTLSAAESPNVERKPCVVSPTPANRRPIINSVMSDKGLPAFIGDGNTRLLLSLSGSKERTISTARCDNGTP